VELDLQRVGDLIVPSGSRFQITKHLNLAYLAQRANFFCRCFEFEGFEGEIGPPKHGGPHSFTRAPISNYQTFKFSSFVTMSKKNWWVF
jgi:hypothetical protein